MTMLRVHAQGNRESLIVEYSRVIVGGAEGVGRCSLDHRSPHSGDLFGPEDGKLYLLSTRVLKISLLFKTKTTQKIVTLRAASNRMVYLNWLYNRLSVVYRNEWITLSSETETQGGLRRERRLCNRAPITHIAWRRCNHAPLTYYISRSWFFHHKIIQDI